MLLNTPFKRFLISQKRNVKYRIISPTRFFVDLLGSRFRSSKRLQITSSECVRLALVSDLDAYTSEQQFVPFSMYRVDLKNIKGIVSAHLMLDDVLRMPEFILSNFDVIALKLTYRTAPVDALRIVKIIRGAIGAKRLIYFDGDDDLCVQWPEILPYLDLYVKKHVFRDRSIYLEKFAGKSNLHDYVHREYGHTLSARDYGNPWDKQIMIPTSGPVPLKQLDKICLGFNVALDQKIVDLYRLVRASNYSQQKQYDVIFRGTANKESFAYFLRRDIEPILMSMKDKYKIILPTKRVSSDIYYREMLGSRVCISPFGYGEICWRDFEAVLCRSLLVKPDMDHVQTRPDIFRPYETYVPVKWDYSDLEEKCEYYLANDVEREQIISRAFQMLDDFYRNREFVSAVSRLISPLT